MLWELVYVPQWLGTNSGVRHKLETKIHADWDLELVLCLLWGSISASAEWDIEYLPYKDEIC